MVRGYSHAEGRLQVPSHFSFIDLLMLTANNSRLRTMAEWHDIFSSADPRFGTIRLVSARGAALAILEVIWEGE
jgi:predicted small integral membrane protein